MGVEKVEWGNMVPSFFTNHIYYSYLCITDFMQFIIFVVEVSATADSSSLAKQVIHFYCWKGSALQTEMLNIDAKLVKLSDEQRVKINSLKSVLLNDDDLALKVFGSMSSEENGCICFDWTGIVAAIAAWEDYVTKLSKQIHLQLPYWRMHESIYTVQFGE